MRGLMSLNGNREEKASRNEKEGVDVAPRLLNSRQVKLIYGIAEKTLANWRSAKTGGPPFIRLSGRMIRYRPEDIEKWLEDRRHANPSANAETISK